MADILANSLKHQAGSADQSIVDGAALPHLVKVELLKTGYLAECSCGWRGPFHANPEPAVQDAIAHERNPWGPESRREAVEAAEDRAKRHLDRRR